MQIHELFTSKHPGRLWLIFCILVLMSLSASVIASQVQQDFGRVAVSNVIYPNSNGILIRAKLLIPYGTSSTSPAPGVVYIHGYQNNRETSDAYCIEMARRGFVVLEIDAIGRGNSGIPGNITDPEFDPSYGGRTSFEYLKSLSYVRKDSVGLMGHSLGAEMAYNIALIDPSVKALTISGFAYTTEASPSVPPNMLMIYGKYDEYRERMTGTKDVEGEWMNSPQTQAAFGNVNPVFGVTYGDFNAGTARKVILLPVIHIFESHSRQGVAEAVKWMRSALSPDDSYWIEPEKQIWEIKEWSTLMAMLTGLASVMPLGLIMLRTRLFSSLQGTVTGNYACSGREFWKHATVNGLLMWLYLPFIFVLFGFHVYVLPIDKVFPMMMVNGTVWWFVWANIIGFLILRRWLKRQSPKINWADLGISFSPTHFSIDWQILGKTALLAILLFVYAFLLEFILEKIFIVDYRFLFPFASDLTPYRIALWFLYFPFLLLGFVLMGIFIHGQMRLSAKTTWWQTFIAWSTANTITLIAPLMLFLLVQYGPLLIAGIIPFVGPGGMLASFTMNLFHIIGVLIIVTPISTWFFQLTGRPYLGAFFNAALVTWMFISSQVIAPIPV
jgi:pimeloyl-ACP methyl ester carboxylesterase